MAYKDPGPIKSKIVINNEISENVNHFKYLRTNK